MKDLFCWQCNSKKVIKKGKQFSTKKTWWRQRYKCLNCGYYFNDQQKHLIDYEEKPFVYESKPIPKTDWVSFNAAQLNEKLMFIKLIDDLLDLVEVEQIQKTGRPSSEIRDMLFAMLLKNFTKLSSRRLISDLHILKDKGFISKVPCYSTLMLYFNDKRLTKLLQELIELAALPLTQLNNETYAVDSSGFSTSQFGRWFDYKWGKEKEKRIYRKAHLICDTVSNTVTAVKLTDQYEADCPQLKHLVKKTALHFNVKEVSADKAYLSKENLDVINSVGAVPFIPFKKNSTSYRGKKCSIWKKMYWYFKKNPQEYFEHYHKRSNVESVFNMIKQKFGGSLMTKKLVSNFNEILCKILCHNVCCLISAYYKFNIETSFCTQVHKMGKISIKC